MEIEGLGAARGKQAIETISKLALEKEKTKRMILIVAAVLLIFGGSALLFSPNEKKTEGIIVGTVMIILALGSIGASTFRVKLPNIEIESKGHSSYPYNPVDQYPNSAPEEEEFSNPASSSPKAE